MLSQLQMQLLNDFQKEFPLSSTPYQDIADSLGISEDEVLKLLAELNQAQFISRIGAIIAPNRIGVSTLVAMAIPSEQLYQVAEIVSKYSEVNHNYERDNYYNLWFVLIANDNAHLLSVIDKIELESGYKAMNLPLLADYYINLGFEIDFDD